MKRLKVTICALLAAMLLLCACQSEPEVTEHVDLNDPLSGESIVSAAELMAFFERGDSDTATLAASISLESDMLVLKKSRGSITINGNGFTLSGNGDCVIRMDDGCSLELYDITVVGGACAVGALGSASVGGSEVVINSITHSFYIDGELTIKPDTSFVVTSSVGNAVKATGLTMERNAELICAGGLSAVELGTGGLYMSENAKLGATTEKAYNALKSGGVVELKNGAVLDVLNSGDYHGAEIEVLAVDGIATINAKGGSQGVGVFLFEVTENITVIGSCEPAPRFEVGKGSITFVETAEEVQTALDAAAAALAETENSGAQDDPQP